MSIRVAGRGAFARARMEKIFDVTLSAAGRFDVTGIPPSFDHLWLVMVNARGDSASTANMNIWLNNDTTAANYRRGRHQSLASSHTVADADDSGIGIIQGTGGTANYVTDMEIKFFNYADPTNNKNGVAYITIRESPTVGMHHLRYIQWENTAAINRIEFEHSNDPTDELVAGTRLQAFGIRGYI